MAVATEIYNYYVSKDIKNSWFLLIEEEAKNGLEESKKNAPNSTLSDEEWQNLHFQKLGNLCGQAFSTFFQFNIPIYTVNSFQKNEESAIY